MRGYQITGPLCVVQHRLSGDEPLKICQATIQGMELVTSSALSLDCATPYGSYLYVSAFLGPQAMPYSPDRSGKSGPIQPV
jgi:hypothetical protein